MIDSKTLFMTVTAVLIANTTSNAPRWYRVVERGTPFASDYGAYLTDENGTVVSPFHDIPLKADGVGVRDGGADAQLYHMVVEIPRGTQLKMEISASRPFNPIAHDMRNAKPRYVANLYPYRGYAWNYGAFPQTWEDPTARDEYTRMQGDGDALDALEIGSRSHERGSVLRVKVLGVVAMIDQGQTDWKVVVIDVDDPKAARVNDVDDVFSEFPELLGDTIEWLRSYKVPDGKGLNVFAFDDEPQNAAMARKVIDNAHLQWKNMMEPSKIDDSSDGEGGSDSESDSDSDIPSLFNTTLSNAMTKNADDARRMMTGDDPLDREKWFFMPLNYKYSRKRVKY